MAGKIDKYSGTWAAIQEHARARIEALRDELEHPTDEAEAQMIRGAIGELRDLLKLTDVQAPIPDESEASHGVPL